MQSIECSVLALPPSLTVSFGCRASSAACRRCHPHSPSASTVEHRVQRVGVATLTRLHLRMQSLECGVSALPPSLGFAFSFSASSAACRHCRTHSPSSSLPRRQPVGMAAHNRLQLRLQSLECSVSALPPSLDFAFGFSASCAACRHYRTHSPSASAAEPRVQRVGVAAVTPLRLQPHCLEGSVSALPHSLAFSFGCRAPSAACRRCRRHSASLPRAQRVGIATLTRLRCLGGSVSALQHTRLQLRLQCLECGVSALPHSLAFGFTASKEACRCCRSHSPSASAAEPRVRRLGIATLTRLQFRLQSLECSVSVLPPSLDFSFRCRASSAACRRYRRYSASPSASVPRVLRVGVATVTRLHCLESSFGFRVSSAACRPCRTHSPSASAAEPRVQRVGVAAVTRLHCLESSFGCRASSAACRPSRTRSPSASAAEPRVQRVDVATLTRLRLQLQCLECSVLTLSHSLTFSFGCRASSAACRRCPRHSASLPRAQRVGIAALTRLRLHSLEGSVWTLPPSLDFNFGCRAWSARCRCCHPHSTSASAADPRLQRVGVTTVTRLRLRL
jgi:hypothetical protein